MESQNTSPPAPSLSQYFSNDPPSFFDEIAKSTPTSVAGTETKTNQDPSITSNSFDGTFKVPEYLELSDSDEGIKVADDVRNFWEHPLIEPGIPPLPTTPGVLTPTDLVDPIREAVKQHLGEPELANRKILTADDVTQDERGLRVLISAGCCRSAVNLTSRLLNIYGQGYGRAGQPVKHTPHSLQLWFTRLALLAKLGQYEILNSEAEPFGQLNRPDLFFDSYPDLYCGKKGSMACFSFRLLLAEMPLYTGSITLATERLTELLFTCREIKNFFKGEKVNYEFWRRREMRILHSIINCSIMMKNFSLIDDLLKVALEQDELTREEKRALYSAWGRIYLNVGYTFGAEQKFADARRLRDKNSPADLRDFVDKGLVAVSQNNFQEAYFNFQKALQQDSMNTMLLNNMGVCLLYCGRLKDAIRILETAINHNPQKSLNESLLVNLSTLYELESSNSKAKKLNLLKLVNRFKPDLNINLEYCLKLQTGN